MTRLVIIVCFITIQAFGQQIKFENFTISEGLSNNSVIDIENDKVCHKTRCLFIDEVIELPIIIGGWSIVIQCSFNLARP